MSGWGWPRIIAHRCGGALAPENTLAGLRIAALLGCRAVEFDVMLSADGEPLLIHDETLDRTAGRPGRVGALAAAELLATDVGRPFHPAFGGETIPRLDTALECCAALGLAVNLEIKPAAGVEQETGRVVGRHLAAFPPPRRPAVLLSSFSAAALDAASSASPDVPRAFLVGRFDAASLAHAVRMGCAALNLSRDDLDAVAVAAVHAAGLRCLVYTVNVPDEARRLFLLGVDGVFSDRPDLLLSASPTPNFG